MDKEQKRLWNKNHRRTEHGLKKFQDWALRSRYGITAETRDAQLTAQNNQCAICKRSDRKLVVDHNHSTGQFRAMLCRGCNLMIGYAHDNPEILDRAIEYLNNRDAAFRGCGAGTYARLDFERHHANH